MKTSRRELPNSELLRTFHTVAEVGNVTHAAERLGRTQSAISLQIRKLEDLMSVHLFDRSSRGVVLTSEGRKLVPLAEKVLSDIAWVGDLFGPPLAGKIRVGIPDDYNETILATTLAAFATRHDQVEIFVRSGCTAGFPDAVRKGELDLALYSAGMLPDRDPIYSEPTVWVASKMLVLPQDKVIPLALFDRHCRWRDVAVDALDSAGISWRIAYMSENFVSVRAAIGAGLGVGILAASAVSADMRILDRKDGFPELPLSALTLLKSETALSDIGLAMEAAILSATIEKDTAVS